MKIAVFSDVHAHNYRAYSSYINGKNSRLLAIRESVDQISSYANENVDVVFFGGDLVHTLGYIENSVYNTMYDAFAKFNVPVYCISGNHDNVKSGYEDDISFLKFGKIPNVKIASFGTVPIHGLDVLFIPYGVKNIVEFCRDKGTTWDIILLHDIPLGSVYNGYIFKEGVDFKELEKYSRLVLFGHIHEQQILSSKTIVIGSPLQHNFGDNGERGFWVVDIDKQRFSREFIPLDFPKFITVKNQKNIVSGFHYYRVLEEAKIEVAESGRSVVSCDMHNDNIIDKYLKYASGIDGYRKYGLDKLNVADAQCSLITPSNFVVTGIEIDNFMSFGANCKFYLRDGIWLVLGESDVFDSNGSGKTSLFDSIFWCLYGKTTKGLLSDDVVNDKVGKDCMVTIKLEDISGSHEIRVIRTRKHDSFGNSFTIQQDGKKVSGTTTDLEKKLVGLLGVDYDFFLNAVYYSQEKVEFFSSATDATKKSFLDSVLQLEKYNFALKSVRVDLTNVKSELEHNKFLLAEIDSQVLKLRKNIEELEEASKKFEELKIENTIRLRGNINDTKIKKVKIEKELKRLEDELEGAVKKKDGVSEIILVEKDEYIAKIAPYHSRVQTAQGELKGLERQKLEYQGVIRKYKSLDVGSKCLVCGSLITKENVQTCINEVAEKLEIILKEIDGLNSNIERDVVTIKNLESENSEVIKKSEAQIISLTNRISSIRTESRGYNNELAKVSEILIAFEKELSALEARTNPHEITIADYKKLIGVKDLEKKSIELEVEENTHHQREYEFWELGFSNAGIKSLLLDEFCKTFNSEIQGHIGPISDGSILVSLSTQEEKTSGVREKLTFNILINGTSKKYNQLSGGEKRRVDIAVIVTLNSIIRKMYNIKYGLLGVLIFDEVFSYLDGVGEETVFSLLQEIIKHVKSIFVITHNDELKSMFDNYIKIKKTNGISEIL